MLGWEPPVPEEWAAVVEQRPEDGEPAPEVLGPEEEEEAPAEGQAAPEGEVAVEVVQPSQP